MNPPLLSSQQAYMAILNFLEKYYELTRSDDIGALLGVCKFLRTVRPWIKHWFATGMRP
jgi:hypothetical protein